MALWFTGLYYFLAEYIFIFECFPLSEFILLIDELREIH